MGALRWRQFVAITFSQIQRKQTFYQQKSYPHYQKLSRLNTKIRKLSDKLKGTYEIIVGINHPQCAEPPNTIIKCVNFNIRRIQNCTSVYQMKLWTVRSALIISRRSFEFIKGSISSDKIDYLIYYQFELHLIDEDTDKANGPQFIWPYFYWSIIRCKDICNHSSSEFIWKIVPLEWREWWFD